MAKQLVLELGDAERRALVQMRDSHPKAYLRERAAALLKISDGHSGREVAHHLLLRPRWQDTIYEWLERYKEKGMAGLTILPGRGRKPLFSPSGSGQRKRS